MIPAIGTTSRSSSCLWLGSARTRIGSDIQPARGTPRTPFVVIRTRRPSIGRYPTGVDWVRLTPAAYNHGLTLALPEAVMARPEGLEPPTL